MDVNDLLRRLDRDGFAVLDGQLDTRYLAAARQEISRLLQDVPWGKGFDGPRTKRLWALLSHSRCMDRAALDPDVLSLVGHLIGPGAQFSLTQAVHIHPGQDAQPLHYEQGIYPVDRTKDVMVTAIWALDDFTAANGGTLVVPGSHIDQDERPERPDAVAIEMSAGSVLVFRGRLWHAGGANSTADSRLGMIIDYVQPWLRPCEAHTLSADPDEVSSLPVRLQELLGFNQPGPYLGFVDGRHPRDWLHDRTRREIPRGGVDSGS